MVALFTIKCKTDFQIENLNYGKLELKFSFTFIAL